MIELGKTLRDAREAKGLSVAQLSDLTHMAPSMIEELENEDFHRITAPIYGRGFIKLYCEAVDLDPQALVAEFMDIYTGNREPAIRERRTEPPAPLPEPAVEPQLSENPPAAEPPSGEVPTAQEAAESDIRPGELFSEFEPIPAPKPPSAIPAPVETPIPPVHPAEPVSAVPSADTHDLSRYATPLRQIHETATNSSVFRFGLLAVGALAILWGCFVGLRALYRATSTTVSENERDARTAEQPPVTAPRPESVPAAKPVPTKNRTSHAPGKPTARTPQKIPSLYID